MFGGIKPACDNCQYYVHCKKHQLDCARAAEVPSSLVFERLRSCKSKIPSSSSNSSSRSLILKVLHDYVITFPYTQLKLFIRPLC